MYRELAGHPFSSFPGSAAGMQLDCPFGFMASELLKPRIVNHRVRRPRRIEEIPTVRGAAWFEVLPHDLQLGVQEGTTIEYLEPGESLVHAGDTPTDWFGVLQGFVWAEGGEAGHTLGLPRRAWFGEHFLLDEQSSECTLVAAVQTRVARVPVDLFNRLMRDPRFCRFLMQVQVQRHAALRQRLAYPRRLTTNAKVGIRLAELFSTDVLFGAECRIELCQSGLSTFLDLSRQRTNAALKRLQQLGEVDVEYGSVRVLKPARLMRRAMDGDIP